MLEVAPLIERLGSFALIVFFVTNVWMQQSKQLREIGDNQRIITDLLQSMIASSAALTERIMRLEQPKKE